MDFEDLYFQKHPLLCDTINKLFLSWCLVKEFNISPKFMATTRHFVTNKGQMNKTSSLHMRTSQASQGSHHVHVDCTSSIPLLRIM